MCEEVVHADVVPAGELKFVNVFLGIAFSTSLSSVALSLTSSTPGCGVCKEVVPADVVPAGELNYLDVFFRHSCFYTSLSSSLVPSLASSIPGCGVCKELSSTWYQPGNLIIVMFL